MDRQDPAAEEVPAAEAADVPNLGAAYFKQDPIGFADAVRVELTQHESEASGPLCCFGPATCCIGQRSGRHGLCLTGLPVPLWAVMI